MPPRTPVCRPTRPDSPRRSLNASQQVGGALGLAIFSALATSRTADLLASNVSTADALTSGFQRALLASSIFLLAASVVALRITNTRGEEQQPGTEKAPDAESQPVTAEPAVSSTY